VSDESSEEEFLQVLARYKQSLRDDIRVLFGRFHRVDLAMKVVGVGSVGTRCAVALFQAAAPDDVLVLQVKEATNSVLEPYAKPSGYENQGERCVMGQRLTQSASDMFLGWASADSSRYYYVRHFRDMKAGVDLTRMREADLVNYAALCGNALALGHARSGAPSFITGYLGNSDAFDEAVADFAVAYADQTDRDYRVFMDAIKSGRLAHSSVIQS
jgi:uncharacterized protein (DUF2252 family)